MEQNQDATLNGFSGRFKQFMVHFKLNPNRLAVQIEKAGDDAAVKKGRVKYARWANGEVAPGYEGLRELAVHYNISLDWLALGEGEMLRNAQPKQATISNIDYKTLYEDEREETMRLRKLNERLSISILEKSGLLTDKEGSKIESSSWTTVKGVIQEQMRAWEALQAKPLESDSADREPIGFKINLIADDEMETKVMPLYKEPVMIQMPVELSA